MMNDVVEGFYGLPQITSKFPGIDSIGENTRISRTVSIWKRVNNIQERGIFIGANVCVFSNVRFALDDTEKLLNSNIVIGNNVYINTGSYISGEGGLIIDDDVLIGPNCNILSAGHQIHNGEQVISKNQITSSPIHIKTGSWIGAGSTILPGVTIGNGAVVGAGSVVTINIPDNAVAVGNPASVIKYRDNN